MIVICEPLCKDFSHEKINSGFIFSFRKAFPEDEIHFFADKTHIHAIQNILSNDNLSIDNINFFPISITSKYNFLSFIINYFIILKIVKHLIINNEHRVFFTSFNTIILYILKVFKAFNGINFYLVLHGSFEEINRGELNELNNQIIQYTIPNKPLLYKIKNITFLKLINFLSSKISKLLTKFSIFQFFYLKYFNTKDILERGTSNNVTYIAISKHILFNANKILDLNKTKILYHFYPNHFSKLIRTSTNKHIKFAIFGYGDPVILYNISKNLEKRSINNKFEIRIIGMDNSITKHFSFIKSPSNGITLKRKEMEDMVNDIDFFLILYGNHKYRLSCSATVLEAISYNKPIIHFKNDCISQFNTPDFRIGYESNSINEFCDYMVKCINDYDNLQETFNMFRINLLKLRSQYSIENNFKNLFEIYK